MLTTTSIPLTPVTAAPVGGAGTGATAGEAAPFGPLFASVQQQSTAARPGMSFDAWLAGAVAAPVDGEPLPEAAGNDLPPAGESLPVSTAPALDVGADGRDQGDTDDRAGADELAALLAAAEPPPAAPMPPATPGVTTLPAPTQAPPPGTVTASATPVSLGGGNGMTGRLLLTARAAMPAGQAPATAQAGFTAADGADPTLSLANASSAATTAGAEPAAEGEFAATLKTLEGATVDVGGNEQPATPALRESPARQYQHLAGTAANASVPVPVGKPGWSEAVVDKVMWFSAQQLSSAEIQLNPPELGPLQVRVSTHQDQTSVYFTSHHAAVRDALDQALPRLREMMDNQGIQLLDVGVGEHGSARQHAFRGEGEGRSGGGAEGEVAGDVDATETSVAPRASVAAGLVDAYA